jgi:tRNA (adenine57-N1/adenine58-N1)-methyltransferase
MPHRGPFEAGELCLLEDVRGRRHLVTLDPGRSFQFDKGAVAHDDLIGAEEGITIRSSRDAPLVALRPGYADYILTMKRGAAVMYPKDTAAMITWADVGPGMVVLEAGTGSGALAMAAARAVGPSGRVVTVERRDDHSRHAQKLVTAFGDRIPDVLEFRIGDVADSLAEVAPDRLLLDVPEPWSVVPSAADHLPGGGGFACYLPTVPQVQSVRSALEDAGVFVAVDTFEVLMRHWAVDGRSVRPEHRMVGHTGFVTVARKRVRIRSSADEARRSGERPDSVG